MSKLNPPIKESLFNDIKSIIISKPWILFFNAVKDSLNSKAQWVRTVGTFVATPLNTYTITTTVDLRATFGVGTTIKCLIGTSYYYAMINTITATEIAISTARPVFTGDILELWRLE